jgi:hypothetical protein
MAHIIDILDAGIFMTPVVIAAAYVLHVAMRLAR